VQSVAATERVATEEPDVPLERALNGAPAVHLVDAQLSDNYLKNPFDAPPIRADPLPGQVDPTGELGLVEPDPLLDSETAPPAPVDYQAVAVEFHGDAAEYARLWYTNLFLTLVSLGLYSPWAAVAQRRYLASRTLIAGVPVVYHAVPLPILKGRVLAAILVAAGWAAMQLMPSAQPLLLAAAILAAPWFLVSTFSFHARNHSWMGLRLDYEAGYWQASKAVLPLLLWPVAIALASGLQSSDFAAALLAVLMPLLAYALLWPWTIASVTQLRFKGLCYGVARARLNATPQDFYKLYSRGMGARFLVLVFIVFAASGIAISVAGPDIAAAVKLATFLLVAAVGTGYARGRRFNLALHRLDIGDQIRFRSSLPPEKLATLYMWNALWLVATLGLAALWRRIATIALRCRHTTVYLKPGFAATTPAPRRGHTALGQSVAEALNLDLSL
jgi:uncharacterized membrane protein YjgN (DUF898 family)